MLSFPGEYIKKEYLYEEGIFYDYIIPQESSVITKDITEYALNKLDIDKAGLDPTDRKYLECLIKRFHGGPVGLEALAATISEETVTLEDVNEPYLLQEGFIVRTHRGRTATEKAYQHLGIGLGVLF